MTDEGYGLTPAFERLVALSCATRPKFMGLIGNTLDPKAFKGEVNGLIVKACKAIFKDIGHGPTTPAILVQRLRRWQDEGSVTKEELDDVIDVLVESDEAPPDREVVAELAPVLRRRAEAQIVRDAMDDYANKRNFEQLQKKISAASRIGVHDESLGSRLGPEVFAEIEKLRHIDKLQLGMPELDATIGGGVPRGTETIFIAGPGGGKSMMLSHSGAYNVANGLFVGYVTAELPEAVIMARVLSSLTLIPISSILEGDGIHKARKACADIYPILGTFIVKEVPPGVVTMTDVRQWVKQCEEDEGRPMDVLIVDYLDKFKSHNRDDKNKYDAMGTIFEDFRYLVHEQKKWGLTATQSRRRAGQEKNRRIEMDDISDSINKARVADLIITITPDAEREQLRYFIAKNRYGKSDVEVGPLPHDWGNGRMAIGGIYDQLSGELGDYDDEDDEE